MSQSLNPGAKSSMSPSMKAALISALVIPGAGHFFLNKKIRGGILAGVAVLCLFSLIAKSMAVAEQVSLKIQNGEIPLDLAEIMTAITRGLASSGVHSLNGTTVVLLACWLFAIVDSYYLGRQQEKSGSSTH